MGSFIEINDTLQITKDQGWPNELVLESHLKTPYHTEDFKDKIFEFRDKPKIRIYKLPPVRNFLVENRNGKWICWGLCHIIELHHDNLREMTSGKFKIIKIYTPEEMMQAENIMITDDELRYFKK
jgi:hypothetical protein